MYRIVVFAIFLAVPTFCQAPAIAGMGYQYPPIVVAPGQLVTVFLAGDVQGDIRATAQGAAVPILEVQPASACQPGTVCSLLTAITIQVPYELQPPCGFIDPVCDVVLLAQLIVTVNGVAGAPLTLAPQPDNVHLLTACDTVVPGANGSPPFGGLPCQPLITHADGSLVTAGSPAHGGEQLVAYAVGLGLTVPAVPTGHAAAAATPTYETFTLNFDFRLNALASQPMQPGTLPSYTGLVPGYAGLYQVNFTVPETLVRLPACSGSVVSNVTVSVGGRSSFDGAGICVE